MPATPFLFSLRQDRCEPEDDFRCGGGRCGGAATRRRTTFVAAGKDGTGGQMSLRRRKMEPEAEYRCGGKRWNRRANVVAAGQAATPAAFYLGLCRLRGNLSPPASATVILKAGRSSVQQRWCCRRAALFCRDDDSAAGGPFLHTTTIVLHRFSSLGLKSRIDARKIV